MTDGWERRGLAPIKRPTVNEFPADFAAQNGAENAINYAERTTLGAH